MNLFLRTGALRRLFNYDPNALRLEYADAYSFFPGKLHVSKLSLRGRDGNVEWLLQIDRCEFWISFLDLARRKFHAGRVQANGLSMRARLRVDVAIPAHDVALPPIPGCTDPPYRAVGPPRAPITDAEYNLWAVQLDDVDVDDVKEVWVDTIRYAGDMRVRGRWLFRPSRWLDVGPAVVDARTLDVSFGMFPLATDLHGTINAAVHPFDVRVPSGLEILHHVSSKAELRGRLLAAAALTSLGDTDKVKFSRGEGPIDIALVVDHGVLRDGTHVEIDVPENEMMAAGTVVKSQASATLDVKAGSTALIALQLSNNGLTNGQGASASADSVKITLTSRKLDLAQPFTDATFAADVRRLQTQALSGWATAWTPIDILSGLAVVDAHFEGTWAERVAAGEVAFSIDDLAVNRNNIKLYGSPKGNIRFDRISIPDQIISLGDSRVDVKKAGVHAGGLDARAETFGVAGAVTVSLRDHRIAGKTTVDTARALLGGSDWGIAAGIVARFAGQYQWQTSQLDLADSNVHFLDLVGRYRRSGQSASVEAPTATVGTEQFTIINGMPKGLLLLDLPRADVQDISGLETVLPLPGGIVFEHGNARGDAHIQVALPSLATTGRCNVSVPDLAVRVASRMLVGQFSLRLLAHARASATDFSGSDLAFGSEPQGSSAGAPDDWWARVELQNPSELQVAPLALTFQVHATAKDASPFAAIIANRTAIPQWLLSAVPMNGLDLECAVLATPSSFEVSSLVARGQDDLVKLEYLQKMAQKTRWAVLVEAGAIHAGFSGSEGGTQFVLFGARPWFEQKAAALRH